MGVWNRTKASDAARDEAAALAALTSTASAASAPVGSAASVAYVEPTPATPRNRRFASAALIVVLCVAALGTCIGMNAFGAAQSARVAVIHDANGATYEMPLDRDDVLTVTTDLGTNVITVQDGSVYVSEANCPNHDCMEQGAISSVDRQIVCLPHKLWIEIIGQDGNGNADTDSSGSSDAEIFDTIGS